MTRYMSTWTALPPLKLIAAGTCNTESLSSYCLRLAKVCGIPWSTFIDLVDAASGANPGSYRDCARLSGVGPVVLRRVRTLERLTGQALLGATLVGLSEILSGRWGTLRKSASWCPRCLADSLDECGIAYSRLIWNFSAYSHCLIHGARIENACPHCGRINSLRGSPLVCSRCNGSLSVVTRYDRPNRAERWTNHCIEELIQWTSEVPSRTLSRSTLIAFRDAVNEVEAVELRSYLYSLRDHEDFKRLSAWYNANVPELNLPYGAGRLDLGDLLRAAAMQCVSVLDMLLQPEESASALLPGVRYRFDVPQGREDCKSEWLQFGKMVDALIADAECYLPSMQELVRTSQVRGYREGAYTRTLFTLLRSTAYAASVTP